MDLLKNLGCRLFRSVVLYLVVAMAFGQTTRSHGQGENGSVSQSGGVVPSRVAIEKLTLTGVDGSLHSFKDILSDGQAVCYTFLYPGCPLAQIYSPVLN